jgi:hypothetical protein
MDVGILLSSLAAGVMGYGGFFLLHLLFSFVAAPSRIHRDNQRKIAELESQLGPQLDLHVWVPFVFAKRSVGVFGLIMSREGLVIILRDIRFTNRSKTNKVSLDLTLLVAMNPASGRAGYLRVKEEKEYWEVPPDCFLFSPIGIDLQETKPGDICFLIPPLTMANCGGEEALDLGRCRLEIVDLISGKGTVKDIGRAVLES